MPSGWLATSADSGEALVGGHTFPPNNSMFPAVTQRRYFAGLSKNTVLLAFTSLFADISSEMLYPVLPIFLTQTLHASGTVVGLVEGIAQATQNMIQGFSGWLSDKLQKRKSPAVVGYLLSALAKPLIGFATSRHPAFWTGWVPDSAPLRAMR